MIKFSKLISLIPNFLVKEFKIVSIFLYIFFELNLFKIYFLFFEFNALFFILFIFLYILLLQIDINDLYSIGAIASLKY